MNKIQTLFKSMVYTNGHKNQWIKSLPFTQLLWINLKHHLVK